MFASSRQCSQRRRMGRCAQARRGAISGQRLTHLFSSGRGLRESGSLQVLEAEGIKYAIRLPANSVLQGRIGYLLTRPVGRPTNEVRCYYANFTYQAGSWRKPRRVIAKVEWHPGELYPRVGFIVTNMSRPAERVVAFYNKRGTCENNILQHGTIVSDALWALEGRKRHYFRRHR